MELAILNTLIGKDDLEQAFLSIIRAYPKVRAVLPILIALRFKNSSDLSIISTVGTSEIQTDLLEGMNIRITIGRETKDRKRLNTTVITIEKMSPAAPVHPNDHQQVLDETSKPEKGHLPAWHSINL